ncbi:LepA like TRAFAC class GTPase [Cryptosporidium canis]|uniref:LepA like TRAFAC class GTPase n=1 Tax=Cryptosporidium canis TaxID=195482 RepID=A0ABQ8P918_9CRYT|nr:LepA like TRAFAC class GTPase [Cryptosporidium canis]
MLDKGRPSQLALRPDEHRSNLNASILDEIHCLYNGLKDGGVYCVGRGKGRGRAPNRYAQQSEDDTEEDEDDPEESCRGLGLNSIGRALNLKVSKQGRKATVMIIGNVSAGKSTLINWLLQENIQKTGMAIETCGISFVMSGKQVNEIGGETALMLLPELREVVKRNPSLIPSLSVKTFPCSQGRLQSINFIDTPGLVDGDSIYSFDIDSVIKDLAMLLCDLVLICIDPSGQALSKRLLALAKHLAENAPHKTSFLLTKIDEIPTEEDRIKVMCQVTQSISSNIAIKHGFDLVPIYIPGAKDGTYLTLRTLQSLAELLPGSENQNTSNVKAKSGRSQTSERPFQTGTGPHTLNRILEVVGQIERVVDRKVQDDIAVLLHDTQTLMECNKCLINKQMHLEKNRENLARQKSIYKKSSSFILVLMLFMAILQAFHYTGPHLLYNSGYIHQNGTVSLDLSPEGVTSAWLFLSASLLVSLLLYRSVQKEEQQYFGGSLKTLRRYSSVLNYIYSRATSLHDSYLNL